MNQKNNLIYIILVLLNLNFISSQVLINNELQISNCYTPSEVSGCLNVECQKKVCKIDNYCCIMNWDQLCVRNANYYCNKANKNLTRNDLTPIMNKIIYNNTINNELNETLNNELNETLNNELNETLNNELNETKINNSQLNETKINNSQLNETKINNSQLNETLNNELENNDELENNNEKKNKNVKSLSNKLNNNICLFLLIVTPIIFN
jgi:hypothetical protein